MQVRVAKKRTIETNEMIITAGRRADRKKLVIKTVAMNTNDTSPRNGNRRGVLNAKYTTFTVAGNHIARNTRPIIKDSI